MGPAPLPPHERRWRHPSELAPTALDVDPAPQGRGWVLATGTAAALLAVVLVVAMTPPRSASPTAVSATTTPSATVRLSSADVLTDLDGAEPTAGTVRTGDAVPSAAAATLDVRSAAPSSEPVAMGRTVVPAGRALALVGAPNAVSSATRRSERPVASTVPDDDDRIVVLTVSHTYDIAWGRLDRVEAPDGSIAMTRDGELLASWVDGELRVLVP